MGIISNRVTTHQIKEKKYYGLLCVLILALISSIIASFPWVAHTGISPLVIAILLGILFGNLYHHPKSWTPGIQFAAKHLLRTAIILYGFRVSFQQIASLGIEVLILDITVVSLTLMVGYLIGRKLLKLDHEISLLVTVGSAICGAAAVLAVEDVLKSEPYKATVAIATVVLFGTLSMFLYPLLYHTGFFGLTDNQFGIFAGASIHEVAQALVAGADVNSDTGKVAVIVKMIRVLLLVPVLFVLAFMNRRHAKKSQLIIPWFAVGFVLVIGFNSLHLLGNKVITVINQADTFLLTIAMGAIGIETKLAKIKKVGVKPLYLAVILFAWLMAGVYLAVKFVMT